MTLVSEGPQQMYSGMFPGVLAQEYSAAEATIDLSALCARTNATLEVSGARRVDADAHVVELRDGRFLPYDVLSINVGARLKGHDLPGVAAHAISVKPFADAALQLHRASAPLLVVGGGVAATEIALVLRRRFAVRTILVTGPHGVVHTRSTFARALRAEVRDAGVRLIEGPRVISAEAGVAALDDGSSKAFGRLIWATGPAAPAVLVDSALDKTADGYLRVDATLRSRSHARIFGAGDCIAIDEHPDLEKAGVFSIRQAPTLLRNVTAALRGDAPVARYAPHQHPLQIINVGSGRALAAWRGLTFGGRIAHQLKRAIDRRWIRDYPRPAGDGDR